MSSGLDKEDERNTKFSLRRQTNPIVQDGRVRDEYQDLLDTGQYTPETSVQWVNHALACLDRIGDTGKSMIIIAPHQIWHEVLLARCTRVCLLQLADTPFPCLPPKGRGFEPPGAHHSNRLADNLLGGFSCVVVMGGGRWRFSECSHKRTVNPHSLVEGVAG